MDNKKLILTDSNGVEYSFTAENCINSSFNFTNPGTELISRFTYEYKNMDEQCYNFYNTFKDKIIVSVSYFIEVEEQESYIDEETQETIIEKTKKFVEIFSSESKQLTIKNVRYNENTVTRGVSAAEPSTLIVNAIIVAFEEE